MPEFLLYVHSLFRWLVLFSLLAATGTAWHGLSKARTFSRADNAVRHWTATIAHVQLLIGILLYTQSPMIGWFWSNYAEASHDPNPMFFGIVHGALMLTAIVVITIGSSLAKRSVTDREKFATVLLWYTAALLIILIAIPWPFSPLAARPYLR